MLSFHASLHRRGCMDACQRWVSSRLLFLRQPGLASGIPRSRVGCWHGGGRECRSENLTRRRMVSMPGSSQRGLRSQCSQKTKRGEAKERGARSSASDSEHRPSGLPTEDAAVAAGDRAGRGAGARALTARGRPAAGAVHRREATGH